MPVKSRKDLTNRLSAARLKAELRPSGQFEIADTQGRSLLMPCLELFMAVQARILWERLYERSTVHGTVGVYLDLKPLTEKDAPEGPSTDREFRVPETGPFWDEALKIVKDQNVRQQWEAILTRSAGVKDVSQRVGMIRQEMDEANIDRWTQFVLLLAHSSNAPSIISTHLLPVVQVTPHFKRHLVVEVLSAAKATESQEHTR
jgi:hypothetical protein